jgi:hypothetical protein
LTGAKSGITSLRKRLEIDRCHPYGCPGQVESRCTHTTNRRASGANYRNLDDVRQFERDAAGAGWTGMKHRPEVTDLNPSRSVALAYIINVDSLINTYQKVKAPDQDELYLIPTIK